MAAQTSSISRIGTVEPFELQVARGQITYHRTITRFGYNSDIRNAAESIWNSGGIFPFPTAAVILTATSSAAGTDENCAFLINGLDASYNEISEVIVLNSSGVGVTTKSFFRVNDVINVGTKSLTGTLPFANDGVTYAYINDGDNRTSNFAYTVPAGYTLYLQHGELSHAAESTNQTLLGKLRIRPAGGVWLTVAETTLNNSRADYDWNYFVAVPEKTDIDATAICSKNQPNSVSASFHGVLIKNEI